MTPVPPGPHKLLDRPWAGTATLAFVLVTLVTLVVVPVLVQRRVTELRARIEASEPARSLVQRLQFSLVRQMEALSDLLLTGGPESSSTYAAARAQERAIFAQLVALTARLNPQVQERVVNARVHSDRWHARIAEDEIVRRSAEHTRLMQIPRERQLFEEVLRSTAAVDAAILSTTAETRAQIGAAEQNGLRLTVLLGILALLAAGVIAVLEARVRRFAKEAERRREEAEAALAEADRANEARTRLLRGITHDVKNPLGAAKGYAELLAMGIKAPLLPEQAPLVEGVQRSVDGALAIISDLLDVARADGGGLTVERIPEDLTRVAEQAVEDHRAAAEAAGHTLDFQPTTDPVRVHTDPARARQVLGNLLSNAIKYTPPQGRITVRTEQVEGDRAPGAGPWAAVRITDTGPGIPAELREAVFDEFSRLDEGREVKGHGLGLAIARRIARLLGGDLVADEQEGSGATFVLWLPCSDDTFLHDRRQVAPQANATKAG